MTTSNIAGAIEKLREEAIQLKKEIEEIQNRLRNAPAFLKSVDTLIKQDEDLLKKIEGMEIAREIASVYKDGINEKRILQRAVEKKVKEDEAALKTAVESFRKLEEEARFAQAKKIN